MARKCGIDHTPILVRDLESGRKAYERLGFKLTPISFHKGRASANHLIVLQRDYTEIAGPAPGTESEPMLDPFFDARGGGGISLIALMTDDAAAEAARMRDQGFAVSGPAPLERPVDYPEYQGLARFSLTMIDTPDHPLVQFFFTQHLTPEALRIPGYEQHPNTALGIAALYIVADEPAQLRPLMEAIFGAERISDEGNGICARTDNGSILVMTPDEIPAWFPECAPPVEQVRPYVLGQRLRVADLDCARACLDEAGVTFAEAPDGALTVAPDEACGALLQFSA